MSEWGPLAGLAGTWEGNDGLDVSFHNVEGAVGETGYLEKVEFKPFGPVENGKQVLFGLDYRMAAWRHGEEQANPFHTEIGYWLWDAAAEQVMRCFMVPRGAVVIAGGSSEADSREFTLRASLGQPTYGILENLYLNAHASTRQYEVTVTVHDDDRWSYREDTLVVLEAMGGPELHHTDQNTLRKVAGS